MNATPNKDVVIPLAQAQELLTALETIVSTVRLAHADLVCGKTGLARARLETLAKLHPEGFVSDVVLAQSRQNVPPFVRAVDALPEWLRRD